MHNSVSDISSEMSFEEKLITAIQNHTCLYNKQSLSYRKKSIKRNAWYKVAEDVGTDGKYYFLLLLVLLLFM